MEKNISFLFNSLELERQNHIIAKFNIYTHIQFSLLNSQTLKSSTLTVQKKH